MNDLQVYLNMGYSEKAADIIVKGKNLGKMETADIIVEDYEDCGDKLILYLDTEDSKIVDASFELEGCIGLQLAGSILTDMIKNKSFDAAMKISFDDVINYAGKVPDDKRECIHFAVNTLKKAIVQKIDSISRAI